jgi:hypothetical protein
MLEKISTYFYKHSYKKGSFIYYLIFFIRMCVCVFSCNMFSVLSFEKHSFGNYFLKNVFLWLRK